jgi:hypothetical protein
VKIRRLLIGCVLFAASASLAVAQESIAPQKRAAIKKLFEVTGVQRNMAATFEELVTLYQANWPGATIADFKAKGMFKPLTPEDAARMERVIHEFSDGVFNEIKKRVVQQIINSEALENLSASVFDKYFTGDEVNELIAFGQSPTGKKFLNLYQTALRASVVSTLQAKGAFNVLPSPKAEEAKATALHQEIRQNPAEVFERVLSSAMIPGDSFTEAEIRELNSFYNTPLGKKVSEKSSLLATEITQGSAQLYGPRVGELTKEVFSEQMEIFQARTHEIFKKYGSRSGKKLRAGKSEEG